MRFHLIVLFVFTFYQGFSQNISSPPSWVKAESIKNIRDVDAGKIDDGYYFVLADEQYNTAEKHNYFHYATKATSETGTETVSQIEITYDPSFEKVHLHFVKVHRGDLVIDRTHTSSFRELAEENERDNGILRNSRTLYANLSDIRKGDIVEYAYSKKGYNEIFGGHFSFELGMGYTVPVGRIAKRLITVPNRKLSIKYRNCHIKPEITDDNNRIYEWAVDNPALVTLESNIPEWFDPYPTILVSSFKSWTEVKNLCNSIFQIDAYNPTNLKKIADSIKANYSNTEDRITGFVDFAQNQIRYSGNTNGIYTHHPHSPEFVLQHRYGDCKDKSVFLHELLKQIDVKSFIVLLDTKKKRNIKWVNPSLNAFNHCILAIQLDDSLFFIDPTYAFQHGSFRERLIPDYGTVVVLDGTENIFTDLTSDTASKTTIIEKFNVINDEGDAELHVETIYTGLNADDFRYYLHNNALVDIQESYRSFYLKYCDDIEVMDTVSFSDANNENLITVTEHYLLKRFWAKADSASKKIEKGFLPYVLNSKIRYVEDKNRKQPLDIPFPANIEQKILVTVPNGWNIAENVITEDNEFFNYSYITSVDENTLTLSYAYRSKSDNVPQEKYAVYKAGVDYVDRNIGFEVTASTNNSDVFGFNWLLAITSLVSAVLSLLICLQLYNMPHPSSYEKRYDGIGGWLILLGIGIFFSPLALSMEVFQLYRDEFNVNYFFYFFDTSSDYYEPLRGYYLILTNFGNIFFIVSSVFLILLYLKRASSFRVYYTYYRLLNLVFLIADLALIYAFTDTALSHEDNVLVKSQAASVGKMAVQCLIWIPYVWYSERSRHTFVN